MTTCPFCEIITWQAPAQIVHDGAGSLGIVPLNPVTPGHVLFFPRYHVEDVTADRGLSAATLFDLLVWLNRRRGEDDRYASVNIITSVGAAATQTVAHLHWHVVPRAEGDGLNLPWTGQATS